VGRHAIRSVRTEDVQQEGHDGRATYKSSLTHASQHPVNRTLTSTLIW
jgi:hypothetical protein